MKKYNIGTGVLFLLLAIGAYIMTFSMGAKFGTDNLGPAFWPKCLTIALGVLSILLILETLLVKKGADVDAPTPINFKSENVQRVLKIAAVLIVFGFITGILGIYIGMLFMMPVCMYLLGERNWKVLVLLSCATCVGIYLIFSLALRVPLPTGIFFD